MEKHFTAETFRKQLKALCPLVDQVRLMLGAARHAFNRHSQVQLAEMARLQKTIILDLDPLFEEVEAGLAQTPAADQSHLLQLKGILSHLELMAHTVAGLAEPIRRKGNHGAILSDKDFFHLNDSFSRLMGLMRALVDILLHDDPSLKAYALRECQSLRDTCFGEETEHETRMMDSPGQPDAWSIYLEILDSFREILAHYQDIVNSLGGSPLQK